MYTEKYPDAESVTVVDTDDCADIQMVKFLQKFYNIPQHLRKKIFSIAYAKNYQNGSWHTTWNKPYDPNYSFVMVLFQLEKDESISQKTFNHFCKNPLFIETWKDDSINMWTAYFKLPSKKDFSGKNFFRNMRRKAGIKKAEALKLINDFFEIDLSE